MNAPEAAHGPTGRGGRFMRLPPVRLVLSLLVFGLVMAVVVALESMTGLRWLIPLGINVAALSGLLSVGIFIERRRPSELGLSPRGVGRGLGVGLLIGAGLQVTVVAVMAIAGAYRAGPPALSLGALATTFLWLGGWALWEEVIFRAIVFRLFDEWLGSAAALAVSALLFGGIHMSNPNASASAALAIAIEAGVMLGAAFLVTRSLWLPWGIHLAWNFFLGPVFGLAVSGYDALGERIFRPTVLGPSWLTGGAFGPEAGLPAVVLGAGAGAVFVWRAYAKGHWRAFPRSQAVNAKSQ